MAVKNVLGFADHLAGDGGLIIDALLQHGGWARSGYHRQLENEIHFQRGPGPRSTQLEYNQDSS
jgi:hypothetical protein